MFPLSKHDPHVAVAVDSEYDDVQRAEFSLLRLFALVALRLLLPASPCLIASICILLQILASIIDFERVSCDCKSGYVG
jgi:hypothetical protein